MTDRSRVYERPRPPLSASARAAIAEHSVPLGYPVHGTLSDGTESQRLSETESAAHDILLLSASTPLPRKAAEIEKKQSSAARAFNERARKAQVVQAKRNALHAAYMDAWSTAFRPIRGLFTTALMLYMAGDNVQAFTITSVITALIMQTQTLLRARSVFRGIVRRQPGLKRRVLPQFLLYTAFCLVGVGLGGRKCWRLGILPTAESDWVALMPVEPPLPRVYGGLTFV